MEDLQEIKKRIGAADAAGALAAAKAAVRSSPSDPSSRSALFSLFAVHGEWARAAEQLDTAIRLGGDIALAVYDIILKAIPDRGKVIRGEAAPNFPGGGEPPEWFPAWQSALAALHNGNDAPLAEAALARSEALDKINGFNSHFEFEGFRNCDTRLGGFFEGIFEGKYSWLPFEQVRRIAVPERPELLHDLIWLPVMVHLQKGEPLKGYLFASYPETAEKGSDAEKLARSTEWDDRFEATDIGRGAQLFALGAEFISIFQLGQCNLNTATARPPATGS